MTAATDRNIMRRRDNNQVCVRKQWMWSTDTGTCHIRWPAGAQQINRQTCPWVVQLQASHMEPVILKYKHLRCFLWLWLWSSKHTQRLHTLTAWITCVLEPRAAESNSSLFLSSEEIDAACVVNLKLPCVGPSGCCCLATWTTCASRLHGHSLTFNLWLQEWERQPDINNRFHSWVSKVLMGGFHCL